MRHLRDEPVQEPLALARVAPSTAGLIRPSTPYDAREIALLLAEAGLHPNIGFEELHWKYWEHREDWAGPRSMVMLQGKRIVAHAGVCPGTCVSLRGEYRTIHLIDWAASADAAGAGVALMKHIARTADALIGIGGSTQTLRILPLLGFRTIGKVTQYVRPLRPLTLITRAQGTGWRRVPRAVRGWFWSRTAPALCREYPVSRLKLNGTDRPPLQLPTPSEAMAVFSRTISSIRHVLACPSTPMELYTWKGLRGQQGYFLLGFAPAQIRLVDCWTNSTAPEDWHELLDAAVWVAQKSPLAAEIVCYASDEALISALESRGFRARGQHPIQLLWRRGANYKIGPLRVQMFDNDSGYSHHGLAELWT